MDQGLRRPGSRFLIFGIELTMISTLRFVGSWIGVLSSCRWIVAIFESFCVASDLCRHAAVLRSALEADDRRRHEPVPRNRLAL